MTALDPCRPFDADDPAERAPVRCTAPAVVEVEPTELQLALDRALAWANRYLSAVIRLAQWGPYLDAGGGADIVAARLALAADELAAGADELAVIVAELQAASGAVR